LGQVNFVEQGLIANVSRDDRGVANGSMGLDATDYDRRGKPSIIVTNYESELPALYQNHTTAAKNGQAARPMFVYASMVSGLSKLNGTFVSWGTGFADLDLDGWEDLIIVNGHAIRHPSNSTREQQPSLLINTGGKYIPQRERGGSFFTAKHNARGMAFGDFDNDGRMDVVVVKQNSPVSVLRNIAPLDGKHWLGLKLKGHQNRDIVGTRVVLETKQGKQTRFIKGGASYASTRDDRIQFGLGADDTIIKCTVLWSHGGQQELTGLALDQYHTVEQLAK
jgi:hypothetical protein